MRLRPRPFRSAAAGLLCLSVLAFAGCGEDGAQEPDDEYDDEAYVEDDDDGEKTTRRPPPPSTPVLPPPKSGPGPDSPIKIKPREPGTPMPAPPKVAEGPDDPNELLEAMDERFQAVLARPDNYASKHKLWDDQDLKERGKHAKRMKAWNTALAELLHFSRKYAGLVGDAGAPRAHFYLGYAASVTADRSSASDALVLRNEAVEALEAFIDAPGDFKDRLADAELHLGTCLMKIGSQSGGDGVARGIPHLIEAVKLLQDHQRGAEAATPAFYVMRTLVDQGREEAAADAAERMRADTAHFGPATETIRRLVRRAGLRVGAQLPEWPDAEDADGKPLKLSDFRGKPLVIHFFQAGVAGRPSKSRAIETVLAPLHRTWRTKGLEMLGVSLDRELTGARLTQIKENWDEWDIDGDPHDGTREATREWAVGQGLEWRWHWDGARKQNRIADHLGAGVSWAVLVDANGMIRWRGREPFDGLEESIAALMTN